MNWFQCVNSYIRVFEEKSFSRAAVKLHTNSSVVSKRVTWLEEQIGSQLIKRTTRALEFTESGQFFYQKALIQVSAWQKMLDETRFINNSYKGPLKIGVQRSLGSKFIKSHLTNFLDKYPDLRLNLVPIDYGQSPSLSFDLFITPDIYNQFDNLSYIRVPLFKRKLQYFVSPNYSDNYLIPETFQQLESHNILMLSEKPITSLTNDKGETVKVSSNITTTDKELIVYLAKKSMGILCSSNLGVQDSLDEGSLIKILKNHHLKEDVVSIFYPKLEFKHAKTELFVNYMKKSFNT
ncbi:LysR family transcriptional regulator [Paraphotobacterium marinum]|uniref:LysR family transcriptional regulator n=1 Tax=Paraphotobacterium marinum TaxID=1755811 RepID=A0A220VG24_9GAMM|nr:LysR family transcriptional regulator [Paraphotobacterium marinum]ASK78903.1 LysR family transcriptional regulator [Paraphotobacterium marinum]